MFAKTETWLKVAEEAAEMERKLSAKRSVDDSVCMTSSALQHKGVPILLALLWYK